jgi:pyridoxamine 5'-phosphate oxidase
VDDPLVLLKRDREIAKRAGDPWASLCVLATYSGERPEARTLVLRDLDERLAIFVNRSSPKSLQIDRHPEVAVLVYLATANVQYRLNGLLDPVAEHVVHANWRARPRIPKVLDWLYRHHLPQSARVSSRETLEALHREVSNRVGDDPTAPDDAIGYFIDPSSIERLELATDRLHDRRRFTRTKSGWSIDILVP